MDEEFYLSADEFDPSELSEQDLAILQAFEAMDIWSPAQTTPLAPLTPAPAPALALTEEDDNAMLRIFITEAQEDITRMQNALSQLEQDAHINPACFVTLRRAGHKLRGTAGAVDFPLMAEVAHHVEVIAEEVSQGHVFPVLGVQALTQAVTVLEHCLQYINVYGYEPEDDFIPLLEATYKTLSIDFDQLVAQEDASDANDILQDTQPLITKAAEPLADSSIRETESIPASVSYQLTQEGLPAPAPDVRVDARRFAKLIQDTEQLLEQHAALENAQVQMQTALQELQAAQTRLQQLDPLLTTLLNRNTPPPPPVARSASSLIARILDEYAQHNATAQSRRARSQAAVARLEKPARWDELDMEHYSELDIALRSLREAFLDMALTNTNVQNASQHLLQSQQEYIDRVTAVRSDTLLMRQAPLSELIPRLQRVVKMSTLGQSQQLQFTTQGEKIELDRDILEALAAPLIQLLRTCIADTFREPDAALQSEAETAPNISLRAHEFGNAITLEVGFSIPIQGGAIDAIREAIEHLNGTISLRRNEVGGVSFLLHLPRSHGATLCLLVHAGQQQLIVPFSQVQRVVDRLREPLETVYDINELLGFPAVPGIATTLEHIKPTLVIAPWSTQREMGIAVDDVVGQVELVVKPLKPYLQRPGITGAAIDGTGSVLLMVDLPTLIRQRVNTTRATPSSATLDTAVATNEPAESAAYRQSWQPPAAQIRILVADDSVYLRQSVLQTLLHEHYMVMEARDGMETLEKLQSFKPDICLLDVEMPNLNGYDVLSMLRHNPDVSNVKVIMLTSRSSEKHIQHARDLGAHDYLIKPCSQETLLAAIQHLLAHH